MSRPRIRTIKPEMWADECVGDLCHGARLLLVGLITMADDEGRLRELPAAILGHVFPYDEVSTTKLARWLSDVEAGGMIVRYAHASKRYIAFRHWTRHQKVDRPSESDLPAPPEFVESSTNGSTIGRGLIDDHSRSLRGGADPIRSDPDPILILFDYWRERCEHLQARPTKDRLAKIRARRSEGYTDEQIREAINGAARGAFVNDTGKRFDDIELICRNGTKLESFIDRATSRPAAGSTSELDRKRLDSMKRLMTEKGAA